MASGWGQSHPWFSSEITCQSSFCLFYRQVGGWPFPQAHTGQVPLAPAEFRAVPVPDQLPILSAAYVMVAAIAPLAVAAVAAMRRALSGTKEKCKGSKLACSSSDGCPDASVHVALTLAQLSPESTHATDCIT